MNTSHPKLRVKVSDFNYLTVGGVIASGILVGTHMIVYKRLADWLVERRADSEEATYTWIAEPITNALHLWTWADFRQGFLVSVVLGACFAALATVIMQLTEMYYGSYRTVVAYVSFLVPSVMFASYVGSNAFGPDLPVNELMVLNGIVYTLVLIGWVGETSLYAASPRAWRRLMERVTLGRRSYDRRVPATVYKRRTGHYPRWGTAPYWPGQ